MLLLVAAAGVHTYINAIQFPFQSAVDLHRHAEWDWRRGYAYLHSTFCDLVITGLVGLRPRSDSLLVINPLVPKGVDWFALDNLRYHGIDITICWDRYGSKYDFGQGLFVWADGLLLANGSELQALSLQLPTSQKQTMLTNPVHEADLLSQ